MARKDPDHILWSLLGGALALAACWAIIYLIVTRGQ